MNADVTINVRVTVNNASVPTWKLRLLGAFARSLGIPLDVSCPR